MDLIQRQIQVGWQLRVFFTEDVFSPANPVLKDALADAARRKVLVVLEDSLAQALPGFETRIEHYFSAHAPLLQLVRAPLFVCGGESAKNSLTLVTDILSQIDRHHLDRHSYLVAVGGGALLDVAGFAATTAHRGLRLVRIPTTTLSQADSGIGVKNAINAFGKKKFHRHVRAAIRRHQRLQFAGYARTTGQTRRLRRSCQSRLHSRPQFL